MHRILVRFAAVAGLSLAGSAALAGSYEFLAAPEIILNRVYRLDKATGGFARASAAKRLAALGGTAPEMAEVPRRRGDEAAS